MSDYVARAGATFEATLDGATSLAGPLTVAIYDTPAAVTAIYGPSSAGVVQNPAGSGLYAVTLTAPATTGTYSIVWSDGVLFARDTLDVTTSVTTALAIFRLELGDIDSANALFNDDEAGYFLAKHPTNLLLAVADACDALAARFAREFDFDANESKSFKRSQKSDHYLAMAKRLRERALTEGGTDGVGGVPTYSFPGPFEWILS